MSHRLHEHVLFVLYVPTYELHPTGIVQQFGKHIFHTLSWQESDERVDTTDFSKLNIRRGLA